MKVAFVEIAGFRGFKDKTRFEFPGGFSVLTGRNGAGKSTVLDAFDFALTGTINKYAVTSAKGGGLDEHIWWVGEGVPLQHHVRVGFIAESGKTFVVTRSRERGLEVPPEDMARCLCRPDFFSKAWAEILTQTSLIRDETIAALSLDLPGVARFAAVRTAIGGLTGPDYAERTKALSRLANEAKDSQKERVESLRGDLSRALNEMTEARSLIEKQADSTEAEIIIKSLAPDLVTSGGDRTEMIRRRIAERKQSISAIEDAIALAERASAEQLYFDSEAGRSEEAAAHAEYEAALKASAIARERLENSQRLEATEQESVDLTNRILSLLDHGETIGLIAGHCPLCDASRSEDEFITAIAAARARISSRNERISQIGVTVEVARRVVTEEETKLTTATLRLAALDTRRTQLRSDLDSIISAFGRWKLLASPTDPDTARRLALQRQEETARLEHALFMLEASGAHDRMTAIESRIERIRVQLDRENTRLSAAERAVEAARQIEHAAKDTANQVLTEQFETVMPLLKELFQRLRPHADWHDIATDYGGRVRASLNFLVGEGRNPQFLFSSGQRRAAGMAFLLAIHLSRPWCLLRSLLLDDPVQHIDDYRALNLVEVLSAIRRTGRQVIVAVEDPALADVLCRRLRSTAIEGGRRFDLSTSRNGSASIDRQVDIFPLPREILQAAEAS